MQQLNDTQYAFMQNERTANQYAIKCTRIMALVVTAVWIMNAIGLFIVPKGIMNVAAGGGIFLFMLPTVLSMILKSDHPRLKYYIMACFILGIMLLSAAMPKHAILAWLAPVVLSCHYYNKRYSYGIMAISIICMIASLFIGMYVGEWDANLMRAFESVNPPREVSSLMIRNMLIFYALPRSMILVGITIICSTLATRTRKLLELQIKDSSEKQQIESELDVATHIQVSMLPTIFPKDIIRQRFDIFASMNPAKEVGGDFYDFFMVDENHLAIVIADVSGKGIPAALFMVIGKTLLKDHIQSGDELGEVFTQVNDMLCESNSEGLFITTFAGVLDLLTGEFKFVNAGHNPPLIKRKGGQYEYLKSRRGFVLAGMDGMLYKEQSITLGRDDEIFLYTDGVTEATNSYEELYGEDRLLEILNAPGAVTAKEICQAVKGDVDRFAADAPQFDDITMLCLQLTDRGPSSSSNDE